MVILLCDLHRDVDRTSCKEPFITDCHKQLPFIAPKISEKVLKLRFGVRLKQNDLQKMILSPNKSFREMIFVTKVLVKPGETVVRV